MLSKEDYNKLNEVAKQTANPDQQGKINVYKCKLGHWYVTIDREYGATPMFNGCEHRNPVDPKYHILKGEFTKCPELSTSRMYQVDQRFKPDFEWYRPSYEYYRDKLSDTMQKWLEEGGLCFRKIGDLDCHQ